MVRKSWIPFLSLCALILYVLLAAANLYWGDLNQDEGWYLYAARQVHEGKLPYRDFAFTQGPMLPLVYSLAQPLVARFGVGGGRLFSALLGLAGAAMAGWLAARSVSAPWKRTAALLAFILIAGSVYQSYFTTVVKTYALCALFLTGGMLALGFARAKHGVAACFISGILLALATGTRHSAGMALPVVFIYLVSQRKTLHADHWFAFGFGGALGLGAISLPFLFMAPDGFLFGMVQYHASRAAGGVTSGLVYKAGFISRLVQAFFLPACLLAAVVILKQLKPAPAADVPAGEAPYRFNGLIWAVVLAISLVHFSAPFPYEDYEVIVYPIFAAALASALIRLVVGICSTEAHASDRWMLWLLVTVFVISVASAFSSPINQSWVLLGRDRIWWKLKKESSLRQLRDVGRWIRQQSGSSRVLLTQDAYLAVETGQAMPPGMDMGPFSYFPDMDRKQAEKIHVLNREMMLELLEKTDAQIAALSGYALAIRSPAISPLSDGEQKELRDIVNRRYEEIRDVADFGQAATTLKILRRKP